ncbi:EamA family transporter, partial [Micromonospora echinofusca]
RPLLAATLRALPAGLLLLAVTRTLPRGRWWGRSALLGLLNFGAFLPLLFLSAYRLPGGVAAVLGAAQPLLVAALTTMLLHQPQNPRRIVAALAAPVGIALVVVQPGAGLDPVGVAAGLTASASMAGGLVLTRLWGRPPGAGVLALTSWQLTAGGALLAPLALAVEGPPPALTGPALAGYGWLALAGTALAYALWFRGAERLPVVQVSLLGALSPLTAVLLGWLVLGQTLTALQTAGFTVALAATAAGQLPDRAGRPRSTTRTVVRRNRNNQSGPVVVHPTDGQGPGGTWRRPSTSRHRQLSGPSMSTRLSRRTT